MFPESITTKELVKRIHATPQRGVIFATGGGTDIYPMLLRRGGGSATLLDGQIPYKETRTDELLGGKPEKYVSEQTTRQLAMAAYIQAIKGEPKFDDGRYFKSAPPPFFGVACSVSLQKTPEERAGRIHYIYAALQTGNKTVSLSLVLDPTNPIRCSALTAETIRENEEYATSLLMLNLVAEACGLKERVETGLEAYTIRTESTLHKATSLLPGLIDGSVQRIGIVVVNGVLVDSVNGRDWCGWRDAVHSGLILPGSFNPVHDGHYEMADYASTLHWSGKTEFELSIRNVDKPLLDFITIENRIKAFRGKQVVWLTNAPTFLEKANLFYGATFVVGYDTAKRIVDEKYGPIDPVMETFNERRTQFIIFGREKDGVFQSGLDEFPESFKQLSVAITHPLRTSAVSSTAIRHQQDAASSS